MSILHAFLILLVLQSPGTVLPAVDPELAPQCSASDAGTVLYSGKYVYVRTINPKTGTCEVLLDLSRTNRLHEQEAANEKSRSDLYFAMRDLADAERRD